MELNKLSVVYYSPTLTSQKIARAVADGIGIARREEYNLTTDLHSDELLLKDSVCIVAAPVYGGLLAPVAVQRLRRLKAENCVAVPVVVYGNRDYEDALVQLRDLLQEQGFSPLCGAAFVGEHSYSRPGFPIAEGRPDAQDLSQAVTFGQQAFQGLLTQLHLTTCPPTGSRDFALTYGQPLAELVTPAPMKGNVPYKTLPAPTPQAPLVNENCYGCGDCVEMCPTGAITLQDGISVTDINLCTKCCACVKFCPVNARVFDTPYTAMLHQKCSTRREPEFFL